MRIKIINLFNVTLAITAGVLFVLNAILATVVYSVGFNAGYNGEPSWDWGQYMSSLGSLFGDIPSLLGLIGLAAIVVVVSMMAHWLAKKGKAGWAVVWFVFGTFLGFFAYGLIDFTSLGLIFVPVIALVVISAFEAIICKVVLTHVPIRKVKVEPVPVATSTRVTA